MTNTLDQVTPGEVVKLLDKDLTLKFTLYSCAQYQRLRGRSILGGQIDATNAEELVALLWAGIISNHPEYDGKIAKDGTPDANVEKTLDALLRSMSLSDVGIMAAVVKRAFEQSTPTVSSSSGAEKNE